MDALEKRMTALEALASSPRTVGTFDHVTINHMEAGIILSFLQSHQKTPLYPVFLNHVVRHFAWIAALAKTDCLIRLRKARRNRTPNDRQFMMWYNNQSKLAVPSLLEVDHLSEDYFMNKDFWGKAIATITAIEAYLGVLNTEHIAARDFQDLLTFQEGLLFICKKMKEKQTNIEGPVHTADLHMIFRTATYANAVILMSAIDHHIYSLQEQQ
ncbi:hypothetical protein IC620_00160 [Hazenella sp. IB182357]|uniref:Uncharacterized protein n=1 Tax=Polycladospora coralii TaxID=2771432 RepID=A0A926NC99_9BACL|nr:hypothetical protein [Polycladospora coralii]MBD1370773.1 hypothetical protein [Polycladospora coralii]MBS7529711.1 hypothetical protein [Polycladospora coralii]